MDKELIVYGASDDRVEFEGITRQEFDVTEYEGWFGKVTDSNGEHVLLHITYGSEGVEWKLRLENMFDWVVTVGERPDYEGDPALFITTPTGKVIVEELDELWVEPTFTVIAE